VGLDDLSYGGRQEDGFGVQTGRGCSEHGNAFDQGSARIDEDHGAIVQAAETTPRGVVTEDAGVEGLGAHDDAESGEQLFEVLVQSFRGHAGQGRFRWPRGLGTARPV
jgi:hypothetical protein